MLRNGLEPWHLLIIVILLVVLFGWKKLPDMARSFGRSARILRSEMDGMKNDKKSEAAGQTVKTQPAAPRAPETQQAPAAAQPTSAEAPTVNEAPAGPVEPSSPVDHHPSL